LRATAVTFLAALLLEAPLAPVLVVFAGLASATAHSDTAHKAVTPTPIPTPLRIEMGVACFMELLGKSEASSGGTTSLTDLLRLRLWAK
jgi:hypothetical protein